MSMGVLSVHTGLVQGLPGLESWAWRILMDGLVGVIRVGYLAGIYSQLVDEVCEGVRVCLEC